jgi:cellulose synthase/poly-beta-1,6-N-acetylglucosamine synthase-like glycosyltransferase
MFYLLIILSFLALILIAGYLWIILNSAAGLRRQYRKIPPKKNESTKFSIIVPFRNEMLNLENLLRDLIGQDYPAEKYEIIFVDDHSTDGGEKMLRNRVHADNLEDRIKIFSLSETGNGFGSKKEAITFGIGKAVHEVIITTDADCSMDEKWLQTLSGFYSETEWRLLWGPVVYEERKGWLEGFYRLDFLALVGIGAGVAGMGRPFMCNGANLLYEKSLFKELMGFQGNERYASGDDVFLLQKAISRFGPGVAGFAYHKDAVVRTEPPSGIQEFLAQRMRWGGKAPGYESSFAKITALIVFLLHMIMGIFFLLGMYYIPFLIPFAAFFITKFIADYYLFNNIRITKSIRWLPWKLFAYEWIYLPYIVVAGTGSIFTRKRWKGRDVKG